MGAIAVETRMEQLRADVEACGPDAIELFESILSKGESIEFAAMCACKKAPGSKGTDRAFAQHSHDQMSSMLPRSRDRILDIARKAGIDTTGKVYKGGLGRYNDPLAWVSSTADILATCKAKNLNCEGMVNHTAVEIDAPPKKLPLGEDIVKRQALRIMREEPKVAEKVRKGGEKAKKELRERIIAQHAPKRR